MEDCKENRKRAHDNSEDSDANSPESTPFDSDLEVNSPQSKRARVDPDLDSPEAKRIQEDLLNILDDPDSVMERGPAIQDLDSVMKSFEEEILFLPPAPANLTSDSSESSQPELGYLLEASDDELGLPPSFASSSGEGKIEAVDFAAGSSGDVGFGELLGFEDEIPSYDSFEFGIGIESDNNITNSSCEFVTLGGLFDYSDQCYEPAEISEFLRRPESLSAL